MTTENQQDQPVDPAASHPMFGLLVLARGKLADITELDKRTVQFHGTQAEWMRKGSEAADATAVDQLIADAGLANRSEWADKFLGGIASAKTLGDFRTELADMVDSCNQLADDLSTAWQKANRTDQTSEADLLAQRETLVKDVNAYRTVLTDQKVPGADQLIVPDAPKQTSKRGGPKAAGSSSRTIKFYRLEADGKTRTYPADSQQKISSVAHYQFNAGVDALEAAMKAAGWDGLYTTGPWEGKVTVTDKNGVKTTTKTIGWEVIAPDQPEDGTDQTN